MIKGFTTQRVIQRRDNKKPYYIGSSKHYTLDDADMVYYRDDVDDDWFMFRKKGNNHMKPLYFVSRNHNLYIVAKTACNHYYIALTLGGKRITSWKRMSKSFIKKHFENYIETCDNLKIYLYDKGVTF